MENKIGNKILAYCGIACCVCGLVIFAASLFGDKSASGFTIWLGAINLINGALFLGLSRKK